MRFTVMLAVPALLLAGCASPQEQVASQENLLSASGFEPRPANTPERVAMLRKLPPNRFSMRPHGNTFTYIYPDPINCGCVYFGDQSDYARYRQTVAARRLANDQLLAAETYNDASWNWGAWGPWGGWGF
ncbi:MAG: hypothetical protein RQ966_13845 [Acetobacteraceae bacterium]|nr:hypothetical protein [Acetobacteraceae bacterium]